MMQANSCVFRYNTSRLEIHHHNASEFYILFNTLFSCQISDEAPFAHNLNHLPFSVSPSPLVATNFIGPNDVNNRGLGSIDGKDASQNQQSPALALFPLVLSLGSANAYFVLQMRNPAPLRERVSCGGHAESRPFSNTGLTRPGREWVESRARSKILPLPPPN